MFRDRENLGRCGTFVAFDAGFSSLSIMYFCLDVCLIIKALRRNRLEAIKINWKFIYYHFSIQKNITGEDI